MAINAKTGVQKKDLSRKMELVERFLCSKMFNVTDLISREIVINIVLFLM